MNCSYFFTLLCLIVSLEATAQQTNDINQSLQCQVNYPHDGTVVVTWLPKAGASAYTVDVRTDGQATFVNVGTTSDTAIIIDKLELSTTHELRITKQGGRTATGYISVAKDYLAPAVDRKLLIVIASSIADSIAAEVMEYRKVLLAERWRSEVLVVDDTLPVADVKAAIVDIDAIDPLTSVLLLGHVPVPYSGNNAIDGHTPDHRGAWVADVYYGDLDGLWTDTFVNNTEANRDANDNVPGDGKFDQNSIPSDVELAVGRVDMSNLPVFAQSEVELIRAYLHKIIAYRTGQFKASRRAIIDNNFNLNEGFAQGAIKLFSGFFDLDSISYGTYSQAYERDYLWTYGAGGGNYRGASGITNTAGLAADSLQTIFTNLFGSYFGDWDIENNFLRAALASGTTLINAWSGRPVWYWHIMSRGATVGECTLLSQNNSQDYQSTFGKRLTHVSLMGDPTLKMYYEAPVSLTGMATDTAIELVWTTHAVADLYMVYASSDEGPFERLTKQPISGTSYIVACPEPGLQTYMVSPVVLETSPSGSYYNEGAGAMIELQGLDNPPLASFSIVDMGSTVSVQNTSQNATSYQWDFGDGFTTTDENPTMHTYAVPGDYLITLIASTACRSDTTHLMVTILSTDVEDSELDKITCYPNPVTGDYLYIAGHTRTDYYELYSIDGRLIASEVITDDGRISMHDYQSGVYLLKVMSMDGNTMEVITTIVK